jgi:hypothetical protein
VSTLIEGDASVTGRRSQASYAMTGRGKVAVPADDSVSVTQLKALREQVAEETVARLKAGLHGS